MRSYNEFRKQAGLENQTEKVRQFILDRGEPVRETAIKNDRAAPRSYRPSHYRPGAVHTHMNGSNAAPIPPFPPSGR